jgi:hypothetical protein
MKVKSSLDSLRCSHVRFLDPRLSAQSYDDDTHAEQRTTHRSEHARNSKIREQWDDEQRHDDARATANSIADADAPEPQRCRKQFGDVYGEKDRHEHVDRYGRRARPAGT